ncbi:MAG TPA: hypothetical protein PKA98_02225 [Acidimicrobiales bacterium]|nr:hypothetical protein [Acidimicrobiales bacterium]
MVSRDQESEGRSGARSRSTPLAPLVAVVVLVGAVAGCGSDGGGGSTVTSSGPSTTTASGEASTTSAPPGAPAGSVYDAACNGELESPETVRVRVGPLVEASGLAVSRDQPGVLWAHNDSGDTARVFAFGEDGRKLGIFTLEGAGATDWEDLAIGPAVDDAGEPVDDADALYLADIGDNAAGRGAVTVYRVPEPEEAAGQAPVRETIGEVDEVTFTYPDGPRDAEALFVDRADRAFYVIEKRLAGGPVGIYRGSLAGWDADPAVPPTLERVGTFWPGASPFASVTGADLSADGSVLAVRTYGSVRLFERPAGTDIADVLGGEPCTGPVPVEAQGEAVAVAPDASAYYTLPEGERPRLSRWAPATP